METPRSKFTILHYILFPVNPGIASTQVGSREFCCLSASRAGAQGRRRKILCKRDARARRRNVLLVWRATSPVTFPSRFIRPVSVLHLRPCLAVFLRAHRFRAPTLSLFRGTCDWRSAHVKHTRFASKFVSTLYANRSGYKKKEDRSPASSTIFGVCFRKVVQKKKERKCFKISKELSQNFFRILSNENFQCKEHISLIDLFFSLPRVFKWCGFDCFKRANSKLYKTL